MNSTFLDSLRTSLFVGFIKHIEYKVSTATYVNLQTEEKYLVSLASDSFRRKYNQSGFRKETFSKTFSGVGGVVHLPLRLLLIFFSLLLPFSCPSLGPCAVSFKVGLDGRRQKVHPVRHKCGDLLLAAVNASCSLINSAGLTLNSMTSTGSSDAEERNRKKKLKIGGKQRSHRK